jgi:hypothetical protein
LVRQRGMLSACSDPGELARRCCDGRRPCDTDDQKYNENTKK